jgi:hypothetical protein
VGVWGGKINNLSVYVLVEAIYKKKVFMKNILQKTVGILIVCVTVFLFNSCFYKKYLANVDPVVVAELLRLGVVPTSVAEVQQFGIPVEGSGYGTWWGYFGAVCEQGGYDLYPYAGKTVTMTSVDIKGTCQSEKIRIYVLSEEDKIACAYLTMQENLGGAPGLWPVNSEQCEY